MLPEGLADRGAVEAENALIFSAGGVRRCRGDYPYLTDRQAVIAEAERRIRERDALHRGIRRTVGPAVFDEAAEERAAGETRRVPPRRRRIVGDGGERARHALRTHADDV